MQSINFLSQLFLWPPRRPSPPRYLEGLSSTSVVPGHVTKLDQDPLFPINKRFPSFISIKQDRYYDEFVPVAPVANLMLGTDPVQWVRCHCCWGAPDVDVHRAAAVCGD